jgi:hypothetical protein
MINNKILKEEWLKVEAKKDYIGTSDYTYRSTPFYRVTITLKSGYEFVWAVIHSDDITEPQDLDYYQIYKDSYMSVFNEAINKIGQIFENTREWQVVNKNNKGEVISYVLDIYNSHKNYADCRKHKKAYEYFKSDDDIKLLDAVCKTIDIIKQEIDILEKQYEDEYQKWRTKVDKSLEANKLKKIQELNKLLDINYE